MTKIDLFLKNIDEKEILIGMAIFFAIISFFLIIVLMLKETRFRRIFGKAKINDLEESLISVRNRIKNLETNLEATHRYLEDAEKRIERSIQNVEIKRFNPFKGTGDGGNQSFTSAFLNEKGEGIVVSTVYARGNTGVFGKPIQNWQSEFELTDEEKEVIKKVKGKNK